MNKIEEFVNTKSKKNTQDFYRLALKKYFECINVNPDNYLNTKRDFEQDIKKFVSTLHNYAPITQRGYISVIKRFFYINDIDFKPKFWELNVKDKITKGYALTLDDKPSISQLKTILSYGDLKAKTLFTVLSSSGMRVSECLQITPDHIDFKSNPTMITLESSMTKGNRPRRVFISIEATNLLKEWLDGGRERYLRELEMCMTGIHQVDRNDKRVFPMKSCAARLLWKRLITKAGLNKKSIETNRYELHPHSLRKFFNSQMKTKIPEVIVEGLMGHSKYLDEAYNRYSLDEIKQHYLEGMSSLMIFETTPDLTDVQKQLSDKDNRIKELEKKMDEMNNTMLHLLAKKQIKLEENQTNGN